MHMDIDKAGGDDLSCGIHHLIGFRLAGGHRSDLAAFQQYVQPGLDVVEGVDNQAVFNKSLHGVASPFRAGSVGKMR